MSPKSLLFFGKTKSIEQEKKKQQPQQSTNKIVFIFIFPVKENPPPLIFIDMFYDRINYRTMQFINH